MMKAVVAGLLAAAVGVPTVAAAQDVSLREAFRQRMEARGGPERVREQNERPRPEMRPEARPEPRGDAGGWRGDRADRPDRPRGGGFEAQAGAAAQAQAQAQARPDRPQGGWQRADRPDRDALPDAPPGGWQQQRGDRADRGWRPEPSPAPLPGSGLDARGGWQQQRGDRADRGGRPEPSPAPVANPGRDPRDGRPLWTERNFRGRPDGDRRAERDRDWNRDWNRNRDNWGRNDGGQRDWGWNGRDRDDRARWDRDWRRDPRYDWNRYRSYNRSAYRLPRYYAPYGWNQGYRRFSIGVQLSSLLFAQNYWIADPYSYRLPDAYGPYRWVRYYDDALLVDVYTGEVVDAMYGFFW